MRPAASATRSRMTETASVPRETPSTPMPMPMSMPMPTPMPPEVAAVFAQWPQAARRRLTTVRALVLAAASAQKVGPLIETLKWGQPAFLARPSCGTTVRLDGRHSPDHCAILVHCGTTLVDGWRERFAAELDFDRNRAIVLPTTGPLAREAIVECLTMALTYHRRRRSSRGP